MKTEQDKKCLNNILIKVTLAQLDYFLNYLQQIPFPNIYLTIDISSSLFSETIDNTIISKKVI